jgi:Lrp/AsnC family leucine-responsive transcriptional regulator
MLSEFTSIWHKISPYTPCEILFLKRLMDEIDRRILNALQVDASQTNAELAACTFPPTACGVKHLRESGVIQRRWPSWRRKRSGPA